MKYYKLLLIICWVMVGSGVWGQSDTVIIRDNIPTLNRIASEYATWKWVLGITATVLTIWSFFGLRFFVKTKANDWIEREIAKKSGLKVEVLKDALAEYARVAELKKKKILVLSDAASQQGNVKKVFDNTGFLNVEWEDIAKIPTLVLSNVHLLLLNDQPDVPITQEQIEASIEKFGKNVACLYFGPKNSLPVGDYRKKYPHLNIGLCNSADRLETGILSLLKLV